MNMTCVERPYIPIIRLKLNCEDPEPINVGFANIKPDLKCGDTYFEVECEDKAHYGLGQALAYRYGGKQAGLIIIVINRYGEVVKFLKWVKENFNLRTMVVVCENNDCNILNV
jgi:hypothetical protein